MAIAGADARGRLDPRALEARTQAIGQELFAAAKREHAHLSVMNRWTAQVLSWCLDDPSVKSRVLRFIDVLPSLRHPQDVARHVHDYFPTTDLRLPAALRAGARLARPGLLTQRALSVVVRQLTEQVARQFIAESRPAGAAHVIQALAARGATCSLDILGEQVLSEPEANDYAAQCGRLLGECAEACARLSASASPMSCGPRVNLSVKPSALTPRFDPISPTDSIERASRRLLPLCDQAAACRALINLDMEQYELRDLTLLLAQRVLVHLPAPQPSAPTTARQAGPEGEARAALGVVIQAYLRDAGEAVERLLAWLVSHERTLTIRLVKGAYWDYEVARAAQCHWATPVYQRKADTDLAFERLTRKLLSAFPLVTTAIASHNVRSIAHAMAAAELLGLRRDQLEFQLLYGMGEALHAAIRAQGFPVRIYTPIGALIPGMAYLVRRILENTANESFLRQEFLQERNADDLLRPPGAETEVSPVHVTAASCPAWQVTPLADFSREEERQRMTQALASVRTQRDTYYPLVLGANTLKTSETIIARNPSHPREGLGTVARAGLADVQQAVQIAEAAQPRWAATSVADRAALLRTAARLMREQRDALAAWEVLEVGKPWREADADVVEAIDYLEYYSERMVELAEGRALLQAPGERNEYRYTPRGVSVVIAPWNFPAAILTGMTAAALVGGNTVIMKPAEQSSVVAAQVARILHAAGIPPEVVHYVPGLGQEIGAALVRHPGTRAILFTGSKAVGLSILEACGTVARGQRFIKHVVAEMGGKNAILVDADADLDEAVAGIVRSAFGYAGQKCSAASRLIVHDAVCDRLLPRLIAATDALVVGDPADCGTDVGPLIEEAAQHRLEDAAAHAREVAHVVYRYPSTRLPQEGYFVGPTIVTDVPREDWLAREELFGPLLCVFRVKTFEEALALANDADYALTGGVYARSPSHLQQAVELFDVGNLYLNRPITGAMVGRQPFGGHRLSGLGTKAGGPDYLLQLLLPKTLSTNTARHGMPLE